MSDGYDSTSDTQRHINTVRIFIGSVLHNLEMRAESHDASKLYDPEKVMYDEFTPLLKQLTYGSEEYKTSLESMGSALEHHYQENSHHPEHYPDGVNGMSLLDLIEMLADWKAASMRHSDGNIAESLKINAKRFNLSDQLARIFENTVREMEW